MEKSVQFLFSPYKQQRKQNSIILTLFLKRHVFNLKSCVRHLKPVPGWDIYGVTWEPGSLQILELTGNS